MFSFKFRNSNPEDREKWFLFFVLSSSLCKQSMKVFGLQIDRGKLGTCSMFFVAEFMCTMFYFTFYRMLFEEFVGWTIFIELQVSHFALEWFVYVIRGTETFYSSMNLIPIKSIRGLLMMQGLSLRDWQVFLSLDFSIRVLIIIFSAPVSIAYLIISNFGMVMYTVVGIYSFVTCNCFE